MSTFSQWIKSLKAKEKLGIRTFYERIKNIEKLYEKQIEHGVYQ